MYLPKHFEIDDPDEIKAFIENHSFGQLISNQGGRAVASHLPFLLSPDGKQLTCHLARANLQWQEIETQTALIIFAGAHDYISPSWYQNPGVPTWNYQTVHVYGRCSLIKSHEEIAELANALTAKHESSFDNPWQPAYNDAMLNAIIGIKIEIDELHCKYKLNQNRSREDRLSVKKQLEATGLPNTARAMTDID